MLMAAIGDEQVGYDDDPFSRVSVQRATAVSRQHDRRYTSKRIATPSPDLPGQQR